MMYKSPVIMLFLIVIISVQSLHSQNIFPETITGNPSATLPSLRGFGDTFWMDPYPQVFDKFKTLSTMNIPNEKIEILSAEKDRFLLIKRNNILYRYNFYKTPFEVVKLKDHNADPRMHEVTDGVLFHVRITIPFVETSLLESKIEMQYGKKTKSTVDPKTLQGVHVWDLDGGYIFLWSEPYNKKSYSRKIDFLSKDISMKIIEESKDYFSSKEKEIIRDIIIR